jgi:hypothetical protein
MIWLYLPWLISGLPFFAFKNVDDFVAVKAHESTEFNKLQHARRNRLNTITWKQQNSTSFNKPWNLVRDQEVVRGKPECSTICFQILRFSKQSG